MTHDEGRQLCNIMRCSHTCCCNNQHFSMHCRMLVIKAVTYPCSFGLLTRCDSLLQQPFYMDALLEVLPDMQACGGWVEQVCDDLLVDLQEAALAQEANLPAFLLLHHTHPALSKHHQMLQSRQSRDNTTWCVHLHITSLAAVDWKLLGRLYNCAAISSFNLPTAAESRIQY